MIRLRLPAEDQWLSPVSSTNKIDRHDITEILLKVALNIMTLTLLKQNKTNKNKTN
jgi:hypothetical protein